MKMVSHNWVRITTNYVTFQSQKIMGPVKIVDWGTCPNCFIYKNEFRGFGSLDIEIFRFPIVITRLIKLVWATTHRVIVPCLQARLDLQSSSDGVTVYP